MTAPKQREIVIEFERVQLIRKRAKTEIRNCDGCGAESDTVSHVEAADLFEMTPGDLFHFIQQNDCHYHVSYNGKTYLCVTSLLERMNQKNSTRLLTAKGE
ncbi:hypothetical protein BH10ACI3_BH10ACI3_24660 [soil metagenome]